ncbi:MAG: M16 family metallopeptidase [Bacteroides sp.]
MIPFERFTLSNGLRVLVNSDLRSPLVSMCIIYDVGARDEDEEHTGYAHLFEHLMFGGSINIPNYDEAIQRAGGSNNAYTSNDLTCYYCTLPASNVETAFWLESDRMLSLAFTPKSLEVQRSVVIEEFKEHYLNAPYGDLYHLASALNYRVHPYRWPTIGLNIEQIEKANMEYIRAFFQAHYFPANAILALSGGISLDQARALCDKWFAPIPSPAKAERHLPTEPPRTAYERQEVVRDVPADLLYISFPMGGRRDKDYVLYDLLSDILGLGLGARLKRELVMKRSIFSSLDASVDGSYDPGVLSIVGTVSPDKSLAEAEEEVWKELELLKEIPAQELTRVKNLFATDALYGELLSSQRAELLAQYELLGDAQWANERVAERAVVTPEMLEACAQQTFLRDRARVLYYQAESKE